VLTCAANDKSVSHWALCSLLSAVVGFGGLGTGVLEAL